MKILMIVLLFCSLASAEAIPQQGLYICKSGNEESICDQMLKTNIKDDRLISITVEYVGYCGSMGPYQYSCVGQTCGDEGIRFEFKDLKHYSWENKQYGFKCDFEKK